MSDEPRAVGERDDQDDWRATLAKIENKMAVECAEPGCGVMLDAEYAKRKRGLCAQHRGGKVRRG